MKTNQANTQMSENVSNRTTSSQFARCNFTLGAPRSLRKKAV